MWRRVRGVAFVLLVLLAVMSPGTARAHDPSTWGGIYRSRDHGATWMLANEGRFVTAALAMAVHPTDPNQLLLATDSGLLHSTNGGRDWEVDGRAVLDGAVHAVALDADGRRALAATAAGIFVREDDAVGGAAGRAGAWRAAATPAGAMPARAIVPSALPGRVFLAGWNGLFRSEDWGATWSAVADGLPNEVLRTLMVAGGAQETVFVVVGGELWAGADGGRSWQPRSNGLPIGQVDTVAVGPSGTEPLWAAGADRLFRSDDRGASWQAVGNPLDQPNTTIRGIAAPAAGGPIVLTTDRGLYRGVDGGQSWEPVVDNLPAHLEARPLVRDPRDPGTLYAGFSIAPYEGIWQTAVDGRSALGRLDLLDLAGGTAFLALLLLAAGWVLRRLSGYYRPPSAPRSTPNVRKPARATGRGRLTPADRSIR